MTSPAPSKVRVVRVYGGDQRLARSGLLWSAKHPMDVDWWWIDATLWCQDINDTLAAFVTPTDVSFTGGDGNMTILATTTANGYFAGIKFLGGTPGVVYGITAVLSGSQGNDMKAIDIVLPCVGDLPAGVSAPVLSDFSNPNNSAAYYYT